MKKKEIRNAKQLDLFQEDNTMSIEDWKKQESIKKPKKKKVEHEKKYGKLVESVMDQLGLVWVHFKNKCFNKFYHTCPFCKKKSLAVCNAHINRQLAGYPDYLIVAGGLEIKHRSYGVKTAKFRKGIQEDVCETLKKKINIICINEESEKDLIAFLNEMSLKIKGEKFL